MHGGKERTIRIAIDGTQSTGKTTLFTALQQQEDLRGFAYLEEAARHLAPKAGIHATEDWLALFESPTRHVEFLQRLYAYQTSLEAEAGRFIVDGSLYKILAYAEVFGFALHDVTDTVNDIRYDLIVYCPRDIAFQSDGFRYQEKRNELAERLELLHARFHRGPLIVTTGSASERVTQVRLALAELKPEQT
jgi:nicotinamide riboside kinase